MTSCFGEFSLWDGGSLIKLGDYAAYGSLGDHGLLQGPVIKDWLADLAHPFKASRPSESGNGPTGSNPKVILPPPPRPELR